MFSFPNLFSGYCRFVGPRVVSIVSWGCNQSFSAFFYVLLKSFYWLVNAVSMLASPLPPFFLDLYSLSTSLKGCYALCMVITFLVLWSLCLIFSLVHFKNAPEYLTKMYSPGIYSFDIIVIFIILRLASFFSHNRYLLFFHWSLNDNKSRQVSRSLLSTLSDLNNAVVWMVSARPPILKSSNTFYQAFKDYSKDTNNDWYHCSLNFP